MILIIFLIIILLPAFVAIKIYNELVKERILVQEGWSGVGTYLQKRLDLIPNLVETVKGFAIHEKEIIEKVAEWHSKGINAASSLDQQQTAFGLSAALRSMFTITQNYPQLRADAHFQNLYASLNEIEDHINAARRYYNGAVREYNQSIAVFAEEAEAQKAPKVNFSGQ
jgi:LemA protein